jgi:AcrR family transcriptional regulator
VSQPDFASLPPRQALAERVSAAILDAAAKVLSSVGPDASMADVAAAAGVARATVYRHFPSRRELLVRLAERAAEQASQRLAAARIDEVPVEESVRRVVRALVEVGDDFLIVAQERVPLEGELFETALFAPLRRAFEHAQGSGTVRGDVATAWLAEALVGTLRSILSARPALGADDTVELVTSLFLDGARSRPPTHG